MAILRDNLEPTDFADADCRVTDWQDFESGRDAGPIAYRIWICKCTNHWFQRHEWQYAGRNSTEIEQWLYSGYYPRKQFREHEKHNGFDILEAK